MISNQAVAVTGMSSNDIMEDSAAVVNLKKRKSGIGEMPTGRSTNVCGAYR